MAEDIYGRAIPRKALEGLYQTSQENSPDEEVAQTHWFIMEVSRSDEWITYDALYDLPHGATEYRIRENIA